jgi:GNAT superfamily N-acetyltransferase
MVGTYQDEEETLARIARAETLIALDGDQIVGTVSLYQPRPDNLLALGREKDVRWVGQFGVAPEWRGHGLGRRMHDQIEAIAREQGARRLALDTPQPAAGLISMYQNWGYRLAGECDWRPKTNFTSFVMVKAVGDERESS